MEQKRCFGNQTTLDPILDPIDKLKTIEKKQTKIFLCSAEESQTGLELLKLRKLQNLNFWVKRVNCSGEKA